MHSHEAIETRHDHKTKQMVLGLGVGLTSYILAEITTYLHGPPVLHVILSLCCLLGYGLFIYGLIGLRQTQHHQEESVVFEDERVEIVRNQAFRDGFVAVLIVNILAVLLVSFFVPELPAHILAHVSIGSGVITAFIRFQQLNR